MEGFLSTPAGVLAITLAQTLALLVPVLLAVAYLTLAERKVLAALQLRRGPHAGGRCGGRVRCASPRGRSPGGGCERGCNAVAGRTSSGRSACSNPSRTPSRR